jgi:hypothetical protein
MGFYRCSMTIVLPKEYVYAFERLWLMTLLYLSSICKKKGRFRPFFNLILFLFFLFLSRKLPTTFSGAIVLPLT